MKTWAILLPFIFSACNRVDPQTGVEDIDICRENLFQDYRKNLCFVKFRFHRELILIPCEIVRECVK